MEGIIRQLSVETGISPDTVKKIFKAYWFFIKSSIQELPLKESLSKEDFNKLKTNFNIPSIGKLSCTYDRWKRLNTSYNKRKSKRDGIEAQKGKTTV